MTRQVLGFVLIASAIIATIGAFTLASYNPRGGLAWNLSNTYVVLTHETRTVRVDCPIPAIGTTGFQNSHLPASCPWTYDEYMREDTRATYTQTSRGPGIQVRLGVALALTTAVALLGIGLIAFGPRAAPGAAAHH